MNIAAKTLALALLLVGTASAAEQFLLQDPSNPQSQSLVVLSANELIVVSNPNTARQSEHVYERFPLLDTGSYLAYYGKASNRYIRWPVDSAGSPLRMIGYGRWEPLRHEIVRLPQPAPTPPPAPPTQVVDVVPNPPLPPVNVELVNWQPYDVRISISDRRNPNARPREYTIPSGSSIRHEIDRDAGATAKTLLVDASGNYLRLIAEKAIPPQEIYDVTVVEYKPVSLYVDRTGKDRLAPAWARPESVRFEARSIGVFSLPAGDRLWDGASLDVCEEAEYRGNPGAANRI